MIVLQIIGWVFLGLLGLFLVLLLVPITVKPEVQDRDLRVRVRVLFVWLTVFPLKQRQPRRPKKQKEKPKQEEAEAEPEKEKKKRTPEEIITLVKRIAASASAGMRWVLRGFWIRQLDLVLPIEADDAAQLAKKYGQMQALVGGARAALSNVVHLHCRRLVLIPDFAGQHKHSLYFSCKVVVSPVIMLVAGIVALVKFLTYKRVNYRVKHTKSTTQKERA